MIPSYTIFHEDTETFSNLWTPYIPDDVVKPGYSYRGRNINEEDLPTVEFLHTDISEVADEICKNVAVE